MTNYILDEQNTALIVRCPHCSLSVDITAVRVDGRDQVVFHDIKRVPETCTRCGSPMNVDNAQSFQDETAVLSNGTPTEKKTILKRREETFPA